MKLKSFLAFTAIILSIGIFAYSCKKDRTCKVSITVEDSSKVLLIGKTVRLYCDLAENPGCIVDTSGISLSDGTVHFEFPLPAILKVKVNDQPKGYVELKPGELVEKVVIFP